MKTITVFFLMIFAIAKTQAQNYQISFTGTGASSIVDSVKVENLTQCTSKTLSAGDILQIIVSSGIDEINVGDDKPVHIYPNPMTGNCSIGFEASAQGNTTIELYDITGKRIMQSQGLLTKGFHTYSLSGLNCGVYTLKIESDHYNFTAKIVSSNGAYGTTELKHIESDPVVSQQNINSTHGTEKSLKGAKSLINMPYTTGDGLKLTGFSGGVYSTVITLVPTQSQTVAFNFIACTDANNHHYPVVQIGNQIWMATNLNVGLMINSTTAGSQQTNNGTTEKYCYNNISDSCNIYGGLYEWNEMMSYHPSDEAMTGTTQGVCPTGWHIPTHHEWTTLERAICTSGTCATDFPYNFTTYGWRGTGEGGKLKESCTTYWNSPNTGATNESGFTALPGGGRNPSFGSFFLLGYYGYFWSAAEFNSATAWFRTLYSNDANVFRYYEGKTVGYSVRCVKDY